MIEDNTVTGAKLVNGSVTADKLAAGSINGASLVDGTVSTAKLVDDSVTGAKIADGSIGSNHLAAGLTFGISKTTVTSTVGAKTMEVIRDTVNGKQRIIAGAPNFERKKIVIAGSSSAGDSGATVPANSWTNLFKAAMEAKGFEVVISATGSETTDGLITRFYTDIVPEYPDFLVLNYTLYSQGVLNGDGSTAYNALVQNTNRIIRMCRHHGIVPVIVSGLANNNFLAAHYRWTKMLNRYLDSMGVIVLNFLGAVDDFTGKFMAGSNFDAIHANDAGHMAYYKSIPLTIFDNLVGVDYNFQTARNGTIRMGVPTAARPMEMVFANPIDSFTVAFKMRVTDAATTNMSFCGFGPGNSRLRSDGANANRLCYTTATGANILSTVTPHVDQQWHDVAVTYSHIGQRVRFYVDGAFNGETAESITFNSFVVGGNFGGTNNAQNVEYKDIVVYRTRLNDEQIKDLTSGDFPRASLELYSSMADEDLGANVRMLNLAPTSSYLKINQAIFTPVYVNVASADIIARTVQFEGGGKIYVEGGSLKFMNSSGVVTTLGGVSDTTPPTDVAGLNATNITSNSARLTWTASTSPDVAGYQIFNGASLLSTVTGTFYDVVGLTAATSYTLTVKARDASGNVSAGAVSTFSTTAGAGSALVTDTFTRANSTTTLGNTDSGHPWTTLAGTWGINNNIARVVVASSANAGDGIRDLAAVETGVANATVRLRIKVADSPVGLAFRVSDSLNFWQFVRTGAGYQVYKVVAGTATSMGTSASPMAVDDLITVTFNGASIVARINGTGDITVTGDAFNQNATRHGMVARGITAQSMFDDFAVDSV